MLHITWYTDLVQASIWDWVCLHNKQLFASDLKLDNIFLSCEIFSVNLQFYNFKSNWLELRDDPTRSLEKFQNWEHNSNQSAGMQKEESQTPKKRKTMTQKQNWWASLNNYDGHMQ
jgi:hypothetical protein